MQDNFREKLEFFWYLNKKFVMKIISITLFVALAFGGCEYLNRQAGLSDDNPVEELIEMEIEARTGLHVDLTPNSPE